MTGAISLVRRLGEQLVILCGYVLAAVALTWPLARDFSTRLIGEVHFDIRHAIWVMWHAREAALGHATWPWTTLLHFPYGMSVLVDGVGPINAVLAWPFWPWGAAAAFNGAALSACALSGWMLYLLARHIGLDRGISFWAGLLFMAWPIHLIAIFGHLEKLFVGLLPLTVLAGLTALDLRRRPAWVLGPAFALLGTLLQNGNQFVFAMLALGLLMVAALYRADAAARRPQAVRVALVVAASLVVCGPMLGAIVQTMRHPWMLIAFGDASPSLFARSRATAGPRPAPGDRASVVSRRHAPGRLCPQLGGASPRVEAGLVRERDGDCRERAVGGTGAYPGRRRAPRAQCGRLVGLRAGVRRAVARPIPSGLRV